jgi:hypothetical protein
MCFSIHDMWAALARMGGQRTISVRKSDDAEPTLRANMQQLQLTADAHADAPVVLESLPEHVIRDFILSNLADPSSVASVARAASTCRLLRAAADGFDVRNESLHEPPAQLDTWFDDLMVVAKRLYDKLDYEIAAGVRDGLSREDVFDIARALLDRRFVKIAKAAGVQRATLAKMMALDTSHADPLIPINVDGTLDLLRFYEFDLRVTRRQIYAEVPTTFAQCFAVDKFTLCPFRLTTATSHESSASLESCRTACSGGCTPSISSRRATRTSPCPNRGGPATRCSSCRPRTTLITKMCRVVVDALQSKPEHNSKQGIVVRRQPGSERWQVRLIDGSEMALREANLFVVAMVGADGTMTATFGDPVPGF